jgi:hypothetical protein
MVLESEALAQMSTDQGVTIRKLGRHEEGPCDCRGTTIFMNGNNITVAGDLVPRTLYCRLDANREDPWRRKFKFDPIELVRRNRSKFLAAAFTIARASMAAGCPQPDKISIVPGFESWSAMVQQPLMWLGMADPFSGIEDELAHDPEQEKLQQLHDALDKCRDDGLKQRFAVSDCEPLANKLQAGAFERPVFKHPVLRELMMQYGQVDTTHFGHVLKKYQGKWGNKFRYIRGPTTGGRATYIFEDKAPREEKTEEEPF